LLGYVPLAIVKKMSRKVKDDDDEEEEEEEEDMAKFQ
jgi:hypothetical protein